jgi:hypothetical protein
MTCFQRICQPAEDLPNRYNGGSISASTGTPATNRTDLARIFGYLQKMINKKDLKKTFATPLERAGCTKKGQTWYLDGKDVLIAINLQKSDWNDLYYVNIGFWLKGLGAATFPAFYDCHLYYRIQDFFPEKKT